MAVCEDADELMAAVESELPDVVLTDIRMPPSLEDEGIVVANRLRETHPGMGVVVVSQYATPQYALALLEHGSDGRAYLLKERLSDRAQLVAALRAVADGGSVVDAKVVESLIAARARRDASPVADLTPREREILSEIAQGKTNQAIAEQLFLTKRAVEKHINAIFVKLGLDERRGLQPAGEGRPDLPRAGVRRGRRGELTHPAGLRARHRGWAGAPPCDGGRERRRVGTSHRPPSSHRPTADLDDLGDLVARPGIVAALDAAGDGCVVVLSAPAGYGKTTLLREWEAAARRPFAWVGLDDRDDDPDRLLSRVTRALRAVPLSRARRPRARRRARAAHRGGARRPGADRGGSPAHDRARAGHARQVAAAARAAPGPAPSGRARHEPAGDDAQRDRDPRRRPADPGRHGRAHGADRGVAGRAVTRAARPVARRRRPAADGVRRGPGARGAGRRGPHVPAPLIGARRPVRSGVRRGARADGVCGCAGAPRPRGRAARDARSPR